MFLMLIIYICIFWIWKFGSWSTSLSVFILIRILKLNSSKQIFIFRVNSTLFYKFKNFKNNPEISWGWLKVLRFKFWWEKSRLGIFFQKILKWFLHHSKDYLRYQKASMGRKVFIFVNKFEVCLFSMNLRPHKKHWVLFLRLKTKNIVKL